MKTTIRISWNDLDGKPNQVIIDSWDEMIHFLCMNKKVDLNVEVFERCCTRCYMADLCTAVVEE